MRTRHALGACIFMGLVVAAMPAMGAETAKPGAERPITRTKSPPDSSVAAPRPAAPASSSIEGVYRIEGGEKVTVKRLMGDIYHLRSPGWEGVGILTKSEYRGMFRDTRTGQVGQHLIDWRSPAKPDVRLAWYVGSETLRQQWTLVADERGREGSPPGTEVETAPHPSELPAFGEYVYVEELPEAITKVQPTYPAKAADQRLQGTVMVQALVLKDGTVGEAKVVKSIPGLDEAAVAAVRQWRFKPAMTKGSPVAVWVATPVTFSLGEAHR